MNPRFFRWCSTAERPARSLLATVRNPVHRGDRHGQRGYGLLHEEGGHQQHRREGVRPPLDVPRRPRPAGERQAAPGLAIEQQVTELVGEGESIARGVPVRGVIRVDDDSGTMSWPCNGSSSNLLVRQCELLDPDVQLFDQSLDIDGPSLRERPVEVSMNLVGQLVSLRPCRG